MKLLRRMIPQGELEELHAIVPGCSRQYAGEEIIHTFQRAPDKDNVRNISSAQHVGGASQQTILLVGRHGGRLTTPKTSHQVRTGHVPTKGFSNGTQLGALLSEKRNDNNGRLAER